MNASWNRHLSGYILAIGEPVVHYPAWDEWWMSYVVLPTPEK